MVRAHSSCYTTSLSPSPLKEPELHPNPFASAPTCKRTNHQCIGLLPAPFFHPIVKTSSSPKLQHISSSRQDPVMMKLIRF